MAYRLNIYLETSKAEEKIFLKSYPEYSEVEMVHDAISEQVAPLLSLDDTTYYEIRSEDLEVMIDRLNERLKTFDENIARDKKERDEVLHILSEDTIRMALTDKESVSGLAEMFYECARRYCGEHDNCGSADFRESLINTIKEFEWYLDMLTDYYRPSKETVKLFCCIV